MDLSLIISISALLFFSFLYWQLLFHLISQILGKIKINRIYKFAICIANVIIPFLVSAIIPSTNMLFLVTFILMLLEFQLFFKCTFSENLFCSLSCIMHVLIAQILVTGIFSFIIKRSLYEISTIAFYNITALLVLFLLMDIAIILVLKLLPIDMIRIVNQHKEPQRFLIAWMAINAIYLLYNAYIFCKPQEQSYLAKDQIAVSLAILFGLYVVVFFAIKAVTLLGYKEKSNELEQAIIQELQFRNATTKDALASYVVNITKGVITSGFEEHKRELGDMIETYTDALIFTANKTIHSDDLAKFMKYASPDNLIREFEHGRSEGSIEYRRLTDQKDYIWVRAIVNLVKDIVTQDLIAYVCIKDINKEKLRQLELLRMAERDMLTGLYNKEITGKLINENLANYANDNCDNGDNDSCNCVLFMIDLDNFKAINDHLGHAFGDAVLCEMADKLRSIFRKNDIVGRIGGDEFIAYIKNDNAAKLAQTKAQEVCEAFTVVYNGAEGEEYKVSCSIGIAIAPKDGENFEKLYKHADVALYNSKNEGKSTYNFYDGNDYYKYAAANKTEIQINDEVTGARTFCKFKEDAQKILEAQTDTMHLLVKLDIDNFKLINQIYGYEKGDKILKYVVTALEQIVHDKDDIFARISNDEFIALFSIQDKKTAYKLYDVFLENFNNLVKDDFSFNFCFPHGVYIIEQNTTQRLDIKDLFEKVNIAHKTAKMDKSKKYVIYEESMTQKALRTKEIESKMASALKNEEFIVYLQPKYYLDTEMIGGAEALSRWQNEDVDLFFPDSFIPVFERDGFITKLDFYVLNKVCCIIKDWLANGITPVIVSVNFSKLHLCNQNFVKELCETVDNVGIERKYIEIEITETAIYDNIETLRVLLNDLHENGFAMSMDDFGSGYSSLGMLKDLPVDVIKMDRSFFANQKDAKRSKIVVGSILEMAENLGIRIVAEGVEEQQHIDLLRELNCDMVQGYYYSKPMPHENFTDLIKTPKKFKKHTDF